MRDEFEEARSTAVFTDGQHPLERKVTVAGPPRPMHVVLVTMESLGADYLESYGGRKGLTPNLDGLGERGPQVHAASTPPAHEPCVGLKLCRCRFRQPLARR